VDVTKAYVTVLAAQGKRDIAETAARTEQQFLSMVREKVSAGQVSPIEQLRAETVAANGRIAFEKAKRDVIAARERLAATWGAREARFIRCDGDISIVSPPPSFARLVALVNGNPDVARWQTEISQREARLAVERSKSVPDLTLSGGVRRYGDG